ncbi:NAD(P)-binding protein [Gonapodya prolifera JEL478]|uniref:NAD(P)-binding protein n=1 Tax=Gonapodya prolifera (strain JEL478) TaxID=1344416 RepID=A0A139AFF6_GONPJ|nr:NAD(P)-binding protein [Gonapodya prolifera JEL478]|eukprot:KXS15536.1 NAD(P)-binding protein [Gonapodya prolifera JEL478]
MSPTKSIAALVTGASRGFGRAIALSFVARTLSSSPLSATSLHLVLASRDINALAESKTLVIDVARSLNREKDIHVATIPLDMSTPPAQLDSHLATLFAVPSALPLPISSYSSAYLFHNAGMLGPLSRARDLSPSHTTDIATALSQDVAAYIALTSHFLTAFTDTSNVVIVNVSSLAAIQPFETWGVYGAGKAARDLFMRTVAEEEGPRVKTLNYAPGPLDTAMQTHIRTSMPAVPLRQVYVDMHTQGKLVKVEDSAEALLDVLGGIKGKWEGNGEHVDYFHVVGE